MSIRLPLFCLVLAFLALFFCYPLLTIFLKSLMPEGRWEPAGLERLVTSPSYLRVLGFTAWQALLSTLLTLLLALPGAYIFTRYQFFAKRLWQALLTVPFVLPTVVAAAAFQALLGPHGLINSLLIAWFDCQAPPLALDQGLGAILLAHVFYNYSLVLRMVSSYWAGLDPNLRAAAATLGASPLQVFWRITLPQLVPVLASASLLVFLFCFSSFGIVLILGGPGFATVEVEIYRQAIHLFNLPMAAALSLVQMGVNFLLMWLLARLGHNRPIAFFGDGGGEAQASPTSPGARLLVGANLLLIGVLLVTPLAALLLSSVVSADGPTLAYYRALWQADEASLFFIAPGEAIGNSLLFALATMAMALTLGLAASLFLARLKARAGAWCDALIMLPLATSPVTLGFGCIIALNHPPFDLRDSLALVVIAHSMVAFPLVVRCLLPALRAIPSSLCEAAATLGASPARVLTTVELPLIRRALLVAAVFAFAVSIGEFGASAFVTRPQTATIPMAIFRFLGFPGEMNYGQAMAMSSLLLVLTGAALLLIGRASQAGPEQRR